MNFGGHMMDNIEYLKTNDLIHGGLNAPSPGDAPVVPHSNGEVPTESAENDAAAKEREEQIERWMNDIKSFIRKIDVSRL